MRTPPPLLPPASDDSSQYNPSWFEAAGADFPLRTKAAGYGVLAAGVVFGALSILSDGPLEEPGRAVVELRRIIELYPASEVARRARVALPDLKARHHPTNARRADP